MTSRVTAPWWVRPTMLSLDGPAFVVLGGLAARARWAARAPDLLLMASVVWAGYLTDRWLDARFDEDGKTWRHEFASRWAPWLVTSAGLAALLAVSAGARLAWSPTMDSAWAVCGLLAGVAAVFSGRWVRLGWVVRAFVVTLLMTSFCLWGEAWSPTSAGSLAVLAAANLAAIRRAEFLGERRTSLVAYGALVVGLGFAVAAPSVLAATTVATAAILCLVDRLTPVAPERSRAMVDVLTFGALVLAIVFG